MWPKKKKKPLPPPSEDTSSIGNLVVEEGLISREEFDAFLLEFQDTKIEMLIGQFLVSKKRTDGEQYMTQEQLEVLLMKQKRMRNGGHVSHEVVMQMLDIAKRTQDKVSTEAKEFCEVTASAVVKLNGSEGE